MKRYLLPLLLLSLPAQAANLSPQQLSITGVAPTYNAASGGGDTFANDGRTYVHLKNGSGAPITVTFDSIASFSDNALGPLTLADLAISVPAGGERVVGFFPPARFNDVTTGRVAMTYSGVTSLSVAVVKVGKVYQ